MSPTWRLGERVYALLVNLYRSLFKRSSAAHEADLCDRLDDPNTTSRIWPKSPTDLGASSFHEISTSVDRRCSMTRFRLPVGALRVAMMVVLLGATAARDGAWGTTLDARRSSRSLHPNQHSPPSGTKSFSPVTEPSGRCPSSARSLLLRALPRPRISSSR